MVRKDQRTPNWLIATIAINKFEIAIWLVLLQWIFSRSVTHLVVTVTVSMFGIYRTLHFLQRYLWLLKCMNYKSANVILCLNWKCTISFLVLATSLGTFVKLWNLLELYNLTNKSFSDVGKEIWNLISAVHINSLLSCNHSFFQNTYSNTEYVAKIFLVSL